MMQLKQAEHLSKVSLPQAGGSRGLASGEGCKGETLPYLRNFLYTILEGWKGHYSLGEKKKIKNYLGS